MATSKKAATKKAATKKATPKKQKPAFSPKLFNITFMGEIQETNDGGVAVKGNVMLANNGNKLEHVATAISNALWENDTIFSLFTSASIATLCKQNSKEEVLGFLNEAVNEFYDNNPIPKKQGKKK